MLIGEVHPTKHARSVIGEGLGHIFPGTELLFSGLDLQLVPGDVVAVVGPSGSGKSTLLSILAGWVTPSAGKVTWNGIQKTGWVFQNPHGVPRRSALDHVVLPLLAQGRLRSEAAKEARAIMAQFGLDGIVQRAFRSLSGGEAQRLMLARAVATKCDLLLVDEPTAQLDIATAATVNEVLESLAMNDRIIVIATHDSHTRDACTRVINLADYQNESSAVQSVGFIDSTKVSDIGTVSVPTMATSHEMNTVAAQPLSISRLAGSL